MHSKGSTNCPDYLPTDCKDETPHQMERHIFPANEIAEAVNVMKEKQLSPNVGTNPMPQVSFEIPDSECQGGDSHYQRQRFRETQSSFIHDLLFRLSDLEKWLDDARRLNQALIDQNHKWSDQVKRMRELHEKDLVNSVTMTKTNLDLAHQTNRIIEAANKDLVAENAKLQRTINRLKTKKPTRRK